MVRAGLPKRDVASGITDGHGDTAKTRLLDDGSLTAGVLNKVFPAQRLDAVFKVSVVDVLRLAYLQFANHIPQTLRGKHLCRAVDALPDLSLGLGGLGCPRLAG
jgi:hypothetical protein